MFRFLIKLIGSILLYWSIVTLPASADFCRQIDSHRVCILDIKRSAKNYWQYQATASIDGIDKPTASYDCRARSITDLDGNQSLFRSRLDSKLICSLYRR